MAANKKFQLKSHLAKREEELDVVGRMVDIEFPNKRFVDPETKKPGRYHSAIVHIVDEDGVKHTWFWPRDEEGMLWTLVTEDQADAIDAGATVHWLKVDTVGDDGKTHRRTSITIVS